MTYLIFPRILGPVSLHFVQLAPILKPRTCNQIGLITSIPAPCLNIARKDFLLPSLMSFQRTIYGVLTLAIPYTQSKHVSRL